MQQSVGLELVHTIYEAVPSWFGFLAGPNAQTSRMARRKEEKDEKDDKRPSHGPQCHTILYNLITCLSWSDWFAIRDRYTTFRQNTTYYI